MPSFSAKSGGVCFSESPAPSGTVSQIGSLSESTGPLRVTVSLSQAPVTALAALSSDHVHPERNFLLNVGHTARPAIDASIRMVSKKSA